MVKITLEHLIYATFVQLAKKVLELYPAPELLKKIDVE
jgi:hypothetical protein